MNITKDVLMTAVDDLLRGNVADFSLDRLLHLITLTQHATDILLNEIELRGELTFSEGMPILPYMSDHYVETILTKPG